MRLLKKLSILKKSATFRLWLHTRIFWESKNYNKKTQGFLIKGKLLRVQKLTHNIY